MTARTDLAMEAYALFAQGAQKTSALSGVRARQEKQDSIDIMRVEILDERGEKALGKPKGIYVTLELTGLSRRETDGFSKAVLAIAREIGRFVGKAESALCVGLGNEHITPDAFGPRVLEHVIVTRHLLAQMPEIFAGFCSVAALRPGVLAQSGMEALELSRAAAQRVKPEWVIVFDALAGMSTSRLCTTVQISDAGLAPGSGLGNCRAAFSAQSLGARVLAVGVPTLMDAQTLAGRKLSGSSGLIVTPGDVDARVGEIARAVGLGTSLALHPELTLEEAERFLA